MALTRDEAWNHLCSWTETDSLRKHARAVELVMRAASARYGGPEADPDVWGLAGMLHDGDYERWPDDHPKRIVAWLRDRGEQELADAISTHYTKWGKAETVLARALVACDELTGFVVACCLVRPDGIASLEAKSVVKRLKDKSFAAKVDRDEIQAGADLLAVDRSQHIQFVIDALRPHSAELGLGGRGEENG
jgi:predicted hydrolase (HD superfamily)